MSSIPRHQPTLWLIAGQDASHWLAAFATAAPELRVVAWPQPVDPATVEYVACWGPPPGLFAPLERLRAVFALGAGVDSLLARSDLPASVPLVKLSDAGMAEQMLEYALLGVLGWQRRMHEYALQQAAARWQPLAPRSRGEVRVGVLGLGAIGTEVAQGLARFGYAVTGWSRRARALPNLHCVAGEEALQPLFAATDVLVNLLPSTPATRGLLDRRRLSWLPAGAYVVNCSRGDQLDSTALLELLDSHRLGGAQLDVFASEPLPAADPLWRHPKVRITPHVAAVTLVEPAVAQIVDNIERFEDGQPMRGVVEREHGY
jgi:glyoxylate/hydroxypyruvate reductase